jgi:hypothetical protein
VLPLIETKAIAKEPTRDDTVDKSEDAANAAAATVAAEAKIATKSAALLAQKLVHHDGITSSQEAALLAGAEEYEQTKMKKQPTTLASSSTHKGNPANNSTAQDLTPHLLVQHFKSAAQVQTKAAALVQANAKAMHAQTEIPIHQDSIKAKAAPANANIAMLQANETAIKAHE